MQQPAEQYELEKRLGAFEQRYRESCSLSRAWGYTLLFSIFILVWGVAFLAISFDQMVKAWPLFLFSLLWFCICALIIVSSWRSYFNEEWLSLYANGFMYHEKDRFQAYRWNEVLSIEIRSTIALNGKNPAVFCSYLVKLENGKTLDLVKGTPLKAHFERYQHQLPETER